MTTTKFGVSLAETEAAGTRTTSSRKQKMFSFMATRKIGGSAEDNFGHWTLVRHHLQETPLPSAQTLAGSPEIESSLAGGGVRHNRQAIRGRLLRIPDVQPVADNDRMIPRFPFQCLETRQFDVPLGIGFQ